MIYVKNLPLWERALRVGVGTAIAVYALPGVGGIWGWAILATGVGMALTGIFGFCPACALTGRHLEQRVQKNRNS